MTSFLVVANRTAGTPALLEEIRRRREAAPCRVALLIPDAPDRNAADWTFESALPLLRKAARGPVEGLVGTGPDPYASVRDAVAEGDFDEIIVSTLPRRSSAWLRRDLPRRLERLGLPVTVITPERDATPSGATAGFGAMAG